MINLYSFRGFEVFLKVPVIIIIRLGENNVSGQIYINKSQYILIEQWVDGDKWFTLHFSFTIIKTKKSHEHDPF